MADKTYTFINMKKSAGKNDKTYTSVTLEALVTKPETEIKTSQNGKEYVKFTSSLIMRFFPSQCQHQEQ